MHPMQFQQPSWFKPQFVGAEFAHDKKQRSDDMFIEVFSGISIAQNPERYVDLHEVKTKMQQKALTLNQLEKYNVQQDLLQKRLVALYEAGSTTYLDMLLSSDGLTQFISNYYLISTLAECDTDLLKSIETLKEEKTCDKDLTKLAKTEINIKAK